MFDPFIVQKIESIFVVDTPSPNTFVDMILVKTLAAVSVLIIVSFAKEELLKRRSL